jgi:hypothetical protein
LAGAAGAAGAGAGAGAVQAASMPRITRMLHNFRIRDFIFETSSWK